MRGVTVYWGDCKEQIEEGKLTFWLVSFRVGNFKLNCKAFNFPYNKPVFTKTLILTFIQPINAIKLPKIGFFLTIFAKFWKYYQRVESIDLSTELRKSK